MNKQIDSVFQLAALSFQLREKKITQKEYDKQFKKINDDVYEESK